MECGGHPLHLCLVNMAQCKLKQSFQGLKPTIQDLFREGVFPTTSSFHRQIWPVLLLERTNGTSQWITIILML